MQFQTYLFVWLFPNYYNYIKLQVTAIQCQVAISAYKNTISHINNMELALLSVSYLRKDLVMSESSHN